MASATRRALGLAVAVAAAFLGLLPGPGPETASARVFLTVEEALRLAFPGCQVDRRTAYLTAGQVARARELAGVEPAGALVNPYVASCEGRPGGVAYFDAHRVRTLPETVMVVVTPAGKVGRVEVLSFAEPPEYMPRPPWYAQFPDRALDEELALKRAIREVTGATLTARATTEAVRRALALHRVLTESGAFP